MKKLIFLVFAFLATVTLVPAQPPVSNSFFNQAYCPAVLYTVEGHIYDGLRIKLNLLTNQVKFVKNSTDEMELTISFRIKKIAFGDCGENGSPVFQTGFPAVDRKQDQNAFYQVLDSGKTMLLKYRKVVEKSGPGASFTSGAVEIFYEVSEEYYLYEPAKGMVKLEGSNKGMAKILEDKRVEIENFMTAKRIHPNKEEDLVKLIAYYNSLH